MAAYRVLVVDDNHEVRRMVTASIKTLGAEIDVLDVPSAEEALFISASLPLDLVVLDFRLPGMSGIDMVGRLRKRRPETKIILVTGVEDALIRQQVSEAGCEAFFFKPIEITKFLEAVKHSLWVEQPEPVLPPVILEPDVSLESAGSPLGTGVITTEASRTRSTVFMPTLDERLTSLKQQLHAVSVLLVDDAGKILEVAGNPAQVTSNPDTLSALMSAFKASLQASQSMGREVCASLQYFATQRQCLYAVPVDLNHALFAVSSSYFEPDKLGTIDRYFQLAAHDLQAILANIAAEEQARQSEQEKLRDELTAEAVVDEQTQERVDDMFAKAAIKGGEAGVESFWETLEDKDTADDAHGKDILSYDQARGLGLAPGEDKQSKAS